MNSRARILVVDDERGIRDLLCCELGDRGFEVVSAEDGEQALRKAAEGNFQLAISDVRMPKRDGLETLKALKEADPHIEVILATGHGTMEAAITAMRKGAYDFVLKPFDIEELSLLVEKALERRELLIHSERLNAVGMIAAGVAHELNNPLTGIMGLAQFLGAEPGLSPQSKDDLAAIVEQGKRCTRIVSDLLLFARRSPPKLEVIDVDAALDAALRFARYDGEAARVTVVRPASKAASRILGDAVGLQQVFLNLIVNAAHAMASSPVRRLEIERIEAERRMLLRFKDTGEGISEENLQRLFTPFFTTKPSGKGTGLGLSICRRIVGQHGGEIRVESRPGSGTTFTVELPCTDTIAEAPCRLQ
ncbi:MAG: response regulator [Elusimicrobia bacterium]|nr:response regulator [Elusimicrobiota bacterium]